MQLILLNAQMRSRKAFFTQQVDEPVIVEIKPNAKVLLLNMHSNLIQNLGNVDYSESIGFVYFLEKIGVMNLDFA